MAGFLHLKTEEPSMNKNAGFIKPIYKKSHWSEIQDFFNSKRSGQYFNEIVSIRPRKSYLMVNKIFGGYGVREAGR